MAGSSCTARRASFMRLFRPINARPPSQPSPALASCSALACPALMLTGRKDDSPLLPPAQRHPRESGDPCRWVPAFAGMTLGRRQQRRVNLSAGWYKTAMQSPGRSADRPVRQSDGQAVSRSGGPSTGMAEQGARRPLIASRRSSRAEYSPASLRVPSRTSSSK